MLRGVWLAALVGCYSPHALPGAPCDQAAPSCPDGQSCAPSGICVAGIIADAARDSRMIDAPDAPIDAMVRPDAPPIDAPVAPWTLVQTAQTTFLQLNVNPTTAGNLIIVAVEIVGTVTMVSDDAANAYQHVPNSTASVASRGLGIDVWYGRSTVAAKRITVAATGTSSVGAVVAWEVAGLRSTNPLDTAAALSDQPASAEPLGAPITTAERGEFVVSVATAVNNLQGIHAGNEFTNDRNPRGYGFAHLTDPAAPAGVHQAVWDQANPTVYCTSSAAFIAGP
jgi:hypothetical protein